MIKMTSFFGDKSEVFQGLNEKAREYAKTRDIDFIWDPQTPYDRDHVIQALRDTDSAVIDVEPYNDEIFSKIGDRCKLLVRFGVGYDKVDLPAASAHGICVARTTGTLAQSVAEMALAHILALRRQLRQNRATVASGVWKKNIGTQTLGKTIGIVGTGAIGSAFARLLRGFDCEILAYTAHPSKQREEELGVRFVELDELFSRCDAISIHIPYTAQTDHLIDARLISMMKPDAVIVNTARGTVIDEDALYDALVSGRIMGAGLDVFSTEPLPADSKFIGLDNVILTPHVGSQTLEALWATYKKTIDITADFFAGRSLLPADLLNPDYKK